MLRLGASLNYAILQPSGSPSPLPSEKFLLTTPSVQLSLFPSTPGAPPSQSAPVDKALEYRSTGTLFTSNQRIVFVAEGAERSSSLAGGSASVVGVPVEVGVERKLQTLSVPYAALHDGRYVQPWFAAQYYEGLVIPARDGGLGSPHVLRMSFKESGGASFYVLVLEMKERLGTTGGQSAHVEPLPLYTPASPTSSSPPAVLGSPPPPPTSTLPPIDDLDAANVAQAAEEDERRAQTSGVEPNEAPPGYEA